MCKKYYLRDEELHSVDDDFFVIKPKRKYSTSRTYSWG